MGSFLSLILLALNIYQIILLARVLLSWFPDINRSNPIIQFLYDITEPVLQPIRNALPQTGTVDFSPLIVFLGISVISMLLTRL
jgi:YggT family protein